MVERVCAPGIVVVEIISGRGQASQAQRWQASTLRHQGNPQARNAFDNVAHI